MRREAAFARQDRFVQKARQQREVRQAGRQAMYKKQMDRLLARKVFYDTIISHCLHMCRAPAICLPA